MTSSLDGRLHPSRWTRSPDGSIKNWSASFEAYHDDLKADAWLVGVGIAPSGPIAMAGAAFAGAGFSLVFPSLGLEAVRRAPAGNRGLAMGTYNAFLDLTLGLGSPALGYLADREGLGAVFLASALAAILAVPTAILLTKTPPPHPA